MRIHVVVSKVKMVALLSVPFAAALLGFVALYIDKKATKSVVQSICLTITTVSLVNCSLHSF